MYVQDKSPSEQMDESWNLESLTYKMAHTEHVCISNKCVNVSAVS